MAIGKTAPNGTLNADGAFYSVQDVNVLLENAGGGGADLPTPTVADAGSVVVVDNEGKYALGEAGGGGTIVNIVDNGGTLELDKSYNEIKAAVLAGNNITILEEGDIPGGYVAETSLLVSVYANTGAGQYIITLFKVVADGQDWKLDVDSYASTTADGVLIKA